MNYDPQSHIYLQWRCPMHTHAIGCIKTTNNMWRIPGTQYPHMPGYKQMGHTHTLNINKTISMIIGHMQTIVYLRWCRTLNKTMFAVNDQ